ncbi:efflux transporter outer membrane subunit [Pectobacterium polaris]|uniref:Efflux transporter outer membrane subunit n=1 Tax=Pectobacterium polaris TaxID=2042057 RepID=A0AAW5GA23_9GAMM|nr:efflux transporter outer membrane subunit [Pectobacterium polaris]MCL6351476.1 efflux transporter outer membrane subunit [Pectobacterium polaris]MCL6368496.1 efflux transporter outer membrane subunit [Pectobacterium polaris]
MRNPPRNVYVRPVLTALATALLLSGCSLAPVDQRPAAPIPLQWSDGAEGSNVGASGKQSASATTALDWQAFVTDDGLRGLITLALNNNRDLRQTLLNVDAARAQYRVQRADRLPSAQIEGSGMRQRVPEDLRTPGAPSVQSNYQAGVGLTSFELDLFGRVRNLSEAAMQEYLATEEAARSAQISLVSEVIQAYLTRDSAQRRYLLATRILEAREVSLRLIDQRRSLGAANELDYQESLGQTQQVRADLERIDREFRQANNALALLVGVNDVRPHLPASSGTGTLLVQELAPGTPSDLLEQRPDIRAAEHRLQARNASIGAARAAFFPRISLTGLFGSSSSELSNLFESGQRAWSFAPQITLPIFDGGRNRANLDLSLVRKDIAIADYEQAIQVAFREVSDALAATDTLRREEQAQRAFAQSSSRTLQLAEDRYRSGSDDHLRVLDAQRNDFASQMTLVQIETQRQIALATLFRTLGGSWRGDVPAQGIGQTSSNLAYASITSR